jgi:hypothetical protein
VLAALDVLRADGNAGPGDRGAQGAARGGDGVGARRQLQAVAAGRPGRLGEGAAGAGGRNGNAAEALAGGVEAVGGDEARVIDDARQEAVAGPGEVQAGDHGLVLRGPGAVGAIEAAQHAGADLLVRRLHQVGAVSPAGDTRVDEPVPELRGHHVGGDRRGDTPDEILAAARATGTGHVAVRQPALGRPLAFRVDVGKVGAVEHVLEVTPDRGQQGGVGRQGLFRRGRDRPRRQALVEVDALAGRLGRGAGTGPVDQLEQQLLVVRQRHRGWDHTVLQRLHGQSGPVRRLASRAGAGATGLRAQERVVMVNSFLRNWCPRREAVTAGVIQRPLSPYTGTRAEHSQPR